MLERRTQPREAGCHPAEGVLKGRCWIFRSLWPQHPCPLCPRRATSTASPPFLGFISFPLEARQGSFAQARLPLPSVSLTF